MAYQAGAATSVADLLSALQAFCMSNGWTLRGNVLSRGACYTSVQVASDAIAMLGGTGIDGSNNLTGPGPQTTQFASPVSGRPFVYPVTYFFHALGDEVYAIAHWGVDAYTHLGFGCSPVAGLPGTGGWYCSSYWGNPVGNLNWGSEWYQGVSITYNGINGTGFFWCPGYATPGNGYVHHGLDGGAWSTVSGDYGPVPGLTAKAAGTAGPLLLRQPNQWNGESLLVPVQVYIDRTSSKMSLIASMAHIRYVVIANLQPEDIITLGSDRWRVYPFFRKGAAFVPAGQDTGYLGMAIRYDGP